MPEKAFMFWLRDLRRTKELSQDELGKLLGVTGPAVGRWESGESLPEPRQLRRLSEFSGYGEVELFTLVGYLSAPKELKEGQGEYDFEHPLMREIVRELPGLDEDGLRLLRDQIELVLKPRFSRSGVKKDGNSKTSGE